MATYFIGKDRDAEGPEPTIAAAAPPVEVPALGEVEALRAEVQGLLNRVERLTATLAAQGQPARTAL